MPERHNDRIRIALSRGEVGLPWTSRTALLEEIRHLDSAQPIIEAFKAVGTSRPVTLAPEQKGYLLELIEAWGDQTHGGLKALPAGVWELRIALHDDLHDARSRRP